jgi:hypothetical protein
MILSLNSDVAHVNEDSEATALIIAKKKSYCMPLMLKQILKKIPYIFLSFAYFCLSTGV